MINENAVTQAVTAIAQQLGIKEQTLTDIVIELQKKHLAWISLDKPYLYPSQGDNQKTCPMLDAMFYIEHHKGIILFLPTGEPRS